eukprot:SAG25_NODE_1658_length_2593_cov_111.862871_3_plen_61_part_01
MVTSGDPWHCDGATKHNDDDLLTALRLGGRWVRLGGPAGDALPTAPPGGASLQHRVRRLAE